MTMPKTEFFMDPTFTDVFAMASRNGNRIELAGQGGWTDGDRTFPEDPTEEIEQAFRNIAKVLAMAGATFDDVADVHSYHVGLPGNQDFVNDTMAAMFKKYMPNHAPTWTDVGVTALGHPDMRVEVRVVAYLQGE